MEVSSQSFDRGLKIFYWLGMFTSPYLFVLSIAEMDVLFLILSGITLYFTYKIGQLLWGT
jgi:hypothetical protein